MTHHESNNSILYAAGIMLTASWLATTVYLMQQNYSLRQEQQHSDNHNHSNNNQETNTTLTTDSQFVMHEIGVIQSPFPQRAGCPRQGTLAPHVKSLLVLHKDLSPQVLEGLLEYSHVWIMFQFHLNTRNKAKNTSSRSSSSSNKFTASKVKPPRAHGKKVGVFATRAPHRPNPVGLSLALLQNIYTNKRKQTCLVLRGLDLVDGTPVYDIKPFVPWDQIESSTTENTSDLSVQMTQLRVPSWVSADDKLAHVTWTESARSDVYKSRQYLQPLYNSSDSDASLEEACRAMEEIIAQDPRAMRDGRGTCSNDNDKETPFEFTFCQLRVKFVVDSQQASIVGILVDDGDVSASKGSYPYNLALRRAAERHAREHDGKTLEWANPVREGVTKGLYDLTNGTVYTAK